MGYKLFLDDKRNPVHCFTYMHLTIGRRNPIYLENGWAIARNFECFKNTVEQMGLPDFISFDHDLTDEHYGIPMEKIAWDEYYERKDRDMTGYDCAKWLVDYCIRNKQKLPEFVVHSMNSVGEMNIMSYLTMFKNGNDGSRI